VKKLYCAVICVISIVALLAITSCSGQEATQNVEHLENAERTLLIDNEPRTGVFTGYTLNGIPQGRGNFTSQNAEGVTWTYTGIFMSGLFGGNGIMEWETGERQVGEFRRGTLYNGSIYCEYGTLVYAVIEGVFFPQEILPSPEIEIDISVMIELTETILREHYEDRFNIQYIEESRLLDISIWQYGVAHEFALASRGNEHYINSWNFMKNSLIEANTVLFDFFNELSGYDFTVSLNLLDDSQMDNVLLSIINDVVVFSALDAALLEEETGNGDYSIVGMWRFNGSPFYVFNSIGGGTRTLGGRTINIGWTKFAGILSICVTPDSCGDWCIAPSEYIYTLSPNRLELICLLTNLTFTYTR